mmetsp:Transcript_13392/g.15028  ORF Transcript_13392/g.15028 Transcript_13392/m.15028 type:complete len:90 (+) Transcript_13392:771-1040(+)
MPPPATGIPASGPPPGSYGGYPASSHGLSLPPAPEDINLPSYGYNAQKPDPPVIGKKPAPAPEPAQAKDDNSADSDDDDLMDRLRNLQK